MPDFKRDWIRSSVADDERTEEGRARFRTLEGERLVARPCRILVLRHVISIRLGERLGKNNGFGAPMRVGILGAKDPRLYPSRVRRYTFLLAQRSSSDS